MKNILLLRKLRKCWFNNDQLAVSLKQRQRVKKIRKLLDVVILDERELTPKEKQFLKELEKDEYFKI